MLNLSRLIHFRGWWKNNKELNITAFSEYSLDLNLCKEQLKLVVFKMSILLQVKTKHHSTSSLYTVSQKKCANIVQQHILVVMGNVLLQT